ncbi:MAG TPA: class I SAM-dependent methyltransferase [Polyangiaceae bacterium]|jgi:SAM-dependent methyltransferase|nr:class I SAM-dependent methyltransferase [Polyangiaceae bacterium]
MTTEAQHRESVVEQFTHQAVPFSNSPAIAQADALRLLVTESGATSDDTVLDVACGPGLVVGAFATVVRHATGIDVTPAMLARAREITAGQSNTTFDCGDVTQLPYADGAFSIVVSRLAFHHFRDPLRVLLEMRRVCRSGGRVVVSDLTASDDSRKADAFHEMETVRDPSHARALTASELAALFDRAGLPQPAVTFYDLPFELENLLARSFSAPGGLERVRAAYVRSLDDDGFGLRTKRVGDDIHGAYRVVILASTCA